MLTKRQQEIFEFIVQHIAQQGVPPTREEIAAAFGFRSPYAAECHIRALEQRGAIERLPGKSRGLRPNAGALANLNQRHSAHTHALTNPQYTGTHDKSDAYPINFAANDGGGELWSIPLIGRVAAGAPILATPHIEQQLRLDPGWFRKRPDYLLRVHGDSMRDAGILDGDLLAVQQRREARNGEIVVARIEDEVTVKRFERRADVVLLHAENPAYAPIEVRANAIDFAIEGCALGVIRDFS
ncbi:MAG: transcriptional repressor LexA [Thioalkalivibrionaceae bacterium]